ncbi:MAG: hypothetical protein JWO19_4505 [Bryobacterales bacterium]|jgi:hypothetical protein|nr:hypothetical protein [Bryobacterales bacterium]
MNLILAYILGLLTIPVFGVLLLAALIARSAWRAGKRAQAASPAINAPLVGTAFTNDQKHRGVN